MATKFTSKNNFVFSGRLTADATTNASQNYARFTLAHNFGKDKDPLFLDFVMFNKNGKKDIKIPFDLLKKGSPVIVEGYLRPDNFTNKEGKTIKDVAYVVLSVSKATEVEADAADAESDAEEEKK